MTGWVLWHTYQSSYHCHLDEVGTSTAQSPHSQCTTYRLQAHTGPNTAGKHRANTCVFLSNADCADLGIDVCVMFVYLVSYIRDDYGYGVVSRLHMMAGRPCQEIFSTLTCWWWYGWCSLKAHSLIYRSSCNNRNNTVRNTHKLVS